MTSSDAAIDVPTAVLDAVIAGSLAGLAARALTHPLDTIKARLQVRGALSLFQPERSGFSHGSRGPLHVPLRGLFSGFGAVAVGIVPANALFFGGSELGKAAANSLLGHQEQTSLVASLCAGLSAQVLGGLIFTPLDVIKEQMQVEALTKRGYADSRVALQRIWQRDGLISGLMRGYWTGLASWGPQTMMYFAAYDWLKTKFQASESPVACAACAGMASATAATITNPLDVIKTRLQALPKHLGGGSVLTVVRRLWEEGLHKSIVAGLSARVGTLSLQTAISFLFYESILSEIRKRRRET